MLNDSAIADWKKNGIYIRSSKAGGLKVFAQEVGSPTASPDKTLLLLHGFPESSFSYHLVVQGLRDRFERILLFDLPGFGFSDKPREGYSYSLLEQADVALEVWKHFGVRGGHLLAHDMGDSVLTELVAREVEQSLPNWLTAGFKSYTLTNGSVVLQFAQLRITQKLLLTHWGKYIARFIKPSVFRHQIKSAHGEAPLDELEITRLWTLNTYNDGVNITHLTIKYLIDRQRYEEKRWLPAVSKTKVPVHICWGDKDNVAKVVIAHYLKEQVCPDAKLTIMEGLGHFCQLGAPESWLEAVLSYYTKQHFL
ncbi:MAG: alpha/beta hydrolase [Bacteroidota bacterium]